MNHENEIQQVIDTFYAIISGSAGEQRDWEGFKALFFSPGSRLAPMKYDDNHGCVTQGLDVETYITGLSEFLHAHDFYEYGFNYNIRVFGRIATLSSEYAAKRRKEDSGLIKQGINLVQLIHDGKAWKIHSMLWKDTV